MKSFILLVCACALSLFLIVDDAQANGRGFFRGGFRSSVRSNIGAGCYVAPVRANIGFSRSYVSPIRANIGIGYDYSSNFRAAYVSPVIAPIAYNTAGCSSYFSAAYTAPIVQPIYQQPIVQPIYQQPIVQQYAAAYTAPAYQQYQQPVYQQPVQYNTAPVCNVGTACKCCPCVNQPIPQPAPAQGNGGFTPYAPQTRAPVAVQIARVPSALKGYAAFFVR